MNARIVYQNGVSKIEINGEIVSSVSFRSFRPQAQITHDFAEGGIRLMNVYPSGILCSLGVPYSQFGEFWLGDGVYDWDVVRAQVNQFSENAPNAYFSLMLQLDTREWFLKEHPECPDSFYHIAEACCCAAWRETARRCIRDILAFFDREYPEKLYAVYVCAGGTCEWYNTRPMIYHPLKEAAYRKWSGDMRKLPTEDEMRKGEHGMLLAEHEKNVTDYWKFVADTIAETTIEFAHEVKQYNKGLLVGCFSGYILVRGRRVNLWSQNGMMKRLFDHPEIDMFFLPASYSLRGLEGTSSSLTGMASLHLHRKLYYHEIDNTTYCANKNIYAQVLQQFAHRRHKSLEESIQYARREASCAFSGLGTYWWFDMFGGWFDDPKLQKTLLDIGKAQETLYSEAIASNAEIAYLYDEESVFYTSSDNALNAQVGEPQVRELLRMGCPIDIYEAGDLTDSRFPKGQYKLYIFCNLTAPTDSLRNAIQKLRAEGANCLFLYASGIIKGGVFMPEAMEELTGIRLRTTDKPFGYSVMRADGLNDSGMNRVFGGKMEDVGTFVYADEADECVFGRGMLTNQPQFVVKDRGNGGFDAWSAQAAIPEFVLRPLAKRAGAFVWQEDGLPMFTNSRMVTLFSHEAGQHVLRVPWTDGRLTELYTGETHEITGREIALTFAQNECKSFYYEKNKNNTEGNA